jgi:hypothetical protein
LLRRLWFGAQRRSGEVRSGSNCITESISVNKKNPKPQGGNKKSLISMNHATSNADGNFWQRLKLEFINSFSNFLSSMASAFLAPETCLPTSILERTKTQMEKPRSGCPLPVRLSKFRYSLVRGHLWFCNNSIEITLCAIPAKPPIGVLKLLNILHNSVREQPI